MDYTQIVLGITSLFGALGTAWFGWKSTREQKSDTIFAQNKELIATNTLLRAVFTKVDNQILLWKLGMRKQLRQLTEDAIAQVQTMDDLSFEQKTRVWAALHKHRETLAKSFDGKFPDLNKYLIEAITATNPKEDKQA